MAFISDDKVEEIRHRADIFEIISSHTQLKRVGRNYSGLCPFHKESKPSFHVNTERQIFKCFGCQKGGDVIRFMMEIHSVSFPEALRLLADRYGIEIPDDPRASAQRGVREIILDLNEKAAAFYQEQLRNDSVGKPARDYLDRRGVSAESVRRFGLGYAPDSWDALCNDLRRKNLDLDRAAQAGLLVKKQGGGFYDRFRGRLMFPIRNSAGKTIAFSGRILVGEEAAKYINSSETDIFIKSNNFYGLDLAVDEIRNAGRAILCEGNLDVIMLHQNGFRESIASLGTALTENHVRRLSRSTDNIILLFDGDEAGQKAMRRALELFLPLDVQPRCVVLPDAHDPDSYLRKFGAKALEELLNGARTLVEFAVERAFAANPPDNEGKTRAVEDILPVLSMISNDVLQDLWVTTVAEKAGVRGEALRRRLASGKRPRPAAAGPARVEETSGNATSRNDPEKALLKLLINYPRLSTRFLEENLAEHFTDSSVKEMALVIAGRAVESQNAEDFDMASLVGRIDDPALQEEAAGWALDDGGIGEKAATKAFGELSRRIRGIELTQRIKDLDREMKKAMENKDQAAAFRIAQEIQKAKSEMNLSISNPT